MLIAIIYRNITDLARNVTHLIFENKIKKIFSIAQHPIEIHQTIVYGNPNDK